MAVHADCEDTHFGYCSTQCGGLHAQLPRPCCGCQALTTPHRCLCQATIGSSGDCGLSAAPHPVDAEMYCYKQPNSCFIQPQQHTKNKWLPLTSCMLCSPGSEAALCGVCGYLAGPGAGLSLHNCLPHNCPLHCRVVSATQRRTFCTLGAEEKHPQRFQRWQGLQRQHPEWQVQQN